jgi:agmatine deiminase
MAADLGPCVAHARERAAERDGLDRAIAERLGARSHRTSLAMEGGGVEVNGRGLMIANEALHRSRNPELSRAQVERELLRLPGLRKVIWLPAGLAEDVLLRATIGGEHVAWGAGGHTDQFVRFADERTVLLAWPDDADAAAHPVARLSRARMQRCHAVLASATDTQGRRLRVVKVPMPRIVQRRVVLQEQTNTGASDEWSLDYFPPQEQRRAGQALWQVATASYLNFVVANGVVVLPDFVPHGTPPAQQERVRRLFAASFPGRRIEFVDGISAHWVGGGLHCATLNQPT